LSLANAEWSPWTVLRSSGSGIVRIHEVCWKKDANFLFLERIPAVAAIDTSIIRAVSGYRICLTAAGHIVLGPASTEVGNSAVPSCEPAIQVAYESYVHGCMDEELVKDAQTDTWEILTLV
jgi:hypothetical protein